MKPDTRSSLIRLSALETKLDTYLFDQDDDRQSGLDLHPAATAANVAGGIAGAGAAGLAGYGLYKAAPALAPAIQSAGSAIAGGAQSAWDLIKSKLGKTAPVVDSLASAALSSKGKLIELAARCAK